MINVQTTMTNKIPMAQASKSLMKFKEYMEPHGFTAVVPEKPPPLRACLLARPRVGEVRLQHVVVTSRRSALFCIHPRVYTRGFLHEGG